MTVCHPHHFRCDFVMYACIPVSWCYHPAPATIGHQTSTMLFLMHFSISSELRRTYVSMQFFQFTVGIGVKRGEVIERIWQVGLIIWRNLNEHRANRGTESNCIISLWRFMSVESRDRKTNREKFSPHSELASAQVFASEARGGGTDSVAWGSQMLIILNIFLKH